MRRFLATALACLSLDGQAFAQPKDAEPWLSAIQPMGWSYLAVGPSLALYVRPFAPSTASAVKKVWARYEKARSSSVELIEANCATGQIRQLQGALYPAPNLGGSPVEADELFGWRYPMPGTMNEAVVEYVCQG